MDETIETAVLQSRKLKGRGRRTQNLSTKLTENEERELETASAKAGKTLSEWARDALLQHARQGSGIPGSDSIVLTEIVGMRLFLMNVLSPLVRGQHLTSEQYQSIIHSVQASKSSATQELLAKRIGETRE
jgi:hypothetical protein